MTRLKLYQTPEHECPYLENKQSITQFLDPNIIPNKHVYSHFSRYGFRRSGDHLYRPDCPNCSECQAVRIIVNDVVETKSQKRCKKAAQKFNFNFIKAADSDEHFQLYEQYINIRHKDGDMFPPTRELFRNFLLSEWANTHFLEIRDDKKILLACAVYDVLDDGISAIYCYFDAQEKRLSLGKLAVLKEIELARKLKLDYLYLGYQIDECRKMNYKTQIKPYEKFNGEVWNRFN